MLITEENGRYSAVTNDGRVISFEDRDEAVACAKEQQRIMRLLGHDRPLEAYIPSEKKAAPEPAPVAVEKKIVRIRIDTDVERIGVRNDTSSVAPKVRHLLPLEKAKEKALA